MSDLGDMISAALVREARIVGLILIGATVAVTAGLIFGVPALWHFVAAHWH